MNDELIEILLSNNCWSVYCTPTVSPLFGDELSSEGIVPLSFDKKGISGESSSDSIFTLSKDISHSLLSELKARALARL